MRRGVENTFVVDVLASQEFLHFYLLSELVAVSWPVHRVEHYDTA